MALPARSVVLLPISRGNILRSPPPKGGGTQLPPRASGHVEQIVRRLARKPCPAKQRSTQIPAPSQSGQSAYPKRSCRKDLPSDACRPWRIDALQVGACWQRPALERRRGWTGSGNRTLPERPRGGSSGTLGAQVGTIISSGYSPEGLTLPQALRPKRSVAGPPQTQEP